MTDKNMVPFGGGDKTFSRISDNPRVEVLLFSGATMAMETCSFYVSTVRRLESAGADKSVVILQDGTAITLSLPYTELVEKIDDGRSPLDLKEYCKTMVAPKAGDKMEDGSVFVGLTSDGPDGKQQIYAMPTDLDVTMTFNNAAAAVKNLNSNKALGHNDWQIPSLENLRVLYKNRDEGALKDTFCKAACGGGSSYPDCYWSSTEKVDSSSSVGVIYLSEKSKGDENWDGKESFRQSCRPVRLVPVS